MAKARGCWGLLLCGTLACSTAPSAYSGSTETGGSANVIGSPPGSEAYVEGSAYWQGEYLCCARGDELGCCEGQETECYEYGGIYRDCIREGEEYEGKVMCGHCCGELRRLGPMAIRDDSGNCQINAPLSLGVCAACGNGICGPGENSCTCPEDCPQ
jgi:hypothetical protein